MEQIANLHIEKLPEADYLATSEDISGLVAQGRTFAETLEIARDLPRKLLKTRAERQVGARLLAVKESIDYRLILAT